MSEFGKTLSTLMEKPESWTVNNYQLTYKPTGATFWIANGGWFFDSEKGKSLGLCERHFLWFKAKRLIDKLQTRSLLNVSL